MNFDRVASFYDRLAWLVFGETWREIQMAPVKFVAESDDVLIVGGGTGLLLEHIHCRKITYLELSAGMLAKARERLAVSEVNFVEADFINWSTNQKFNKVVFPFFLDCFQQDRVNQILSKSRQLLSPNGNLLVIDFQKTTWWKNLLVKVMHLFFGVFSGLESRKLLPYADLLNQQGYQELERQEFMGGWVFCSCWEVK